MFGSQRDQNFSVGGANYTAIRIDKVCGGIREADVVENIGQVLFGNLAANGLFYLVAERCGLFDARTDGGAHVQADLSGIHGGKQVITKERNQSPK